jgi:endogenous inhibitor of DNA gyrase (YacG/DUF329 family)
VKKRDGYECVNCGSSNHIHAHHKVHWGEDEALRYDIDNGLTLCTNCHAILHPEWANMILFPVRRSGTTKKCLACGKEFYTPSYKKDTAKFCSHKCQLSNLPNHLYGRVDKKDAYEKRSIAQHARCAPRRENPRGEISGALHEALGVPQGKKIPAGKLAIHEGDSPLMKRRKTLAKTLKGFKK